MRLRTGPATRRRLRGNAVHRRWNNVKVIRLAFMGLSKIGVLHMNDERKSSEAGKRASEGLREATAKEEAKNESKTGHELAKGADRFEERSKSSDGKSAQEKQKE